MFNSNNSTVIVSKTSSYKQLMLKTVKHLLQENVEILSYDIDIVGKKRTPVFIPIKAIKTVKVNEHALAMFENRFGQTYAIRCPVWQLFVTLNRKNIKASELSIEDAFLDDQNNICKMKSIKLVRQRLDYSYLETGKNSSYCFDGIFIAP